MMHGKRKMQLEMQKLMKKRNRLYYGLHGDGFILIMSVKEGTTTASLN